MSFEDLSFNHAENMGGTLAELLLMDVEDLDLTALPDLAAAGDMKIATLAPKAGKGFAKLYVTEQTGTNTNDEQGERDGMSKINRFAFFHPGNKEEVAKFERKAMNRKLVALVKETDGVYRAYGPAVLDAEDTKITILPVVMMEHKYTSGAARADRRGTSFVIEFHAPHRPLIFTGEPVLIPTIP